MASARFTLVGAKQLEATLKSMGKKVYRRVMKRSLRRAYKPVVREMKRRAPKQTGALRASIAGVVRESRRELHAYAVVGPRKHFVQFAAGDKWIRAGDRLAKELMAAGVGRGTRRIPDNYAHLVEFGVKPHPIKNFLGRPGVSVMHPGISEDKAKPFVKPGFDATKRQAYRILKDEMWRGIKEAARQSINKMAS